uniref:Uncharacterized protein n=1 Tax=Eutreptiella gymnastica TaxID=73025 RepID=A0A7S1I9R3_9EUGL
MYQETTIMPKPDPLFPQSKCPNCHDPFSTEKLDHCGALALAQPCLLAPLTFFSDPWLKPGYGPATGMFIAAQAAVSVKSHWWSLVPPGLGPNMAVAWLRLPAILPLALLRMCSMALQAALD